MKDDTRNVSPPSMQNVLNAGPHAVSDEALRLLVQFVSDHARGVEALVRLAGSLEGGMRSTIRKQNRRMSPADKEALAISELLRRAPYIPSMEEIADELGFSRSAVYLMETLKSRRKEAIAAAKSRRTLRGYVDRRRAGEREFDAWEEEDLE